MDLHNALEEIWQAFGPQAMEVGEFTVADLAREQGVTYDVARRSMERALRAGAVTRRWLNGRKVWAYKKA